MGSSYMRSASAAFIGCSVALTAVLISGVTAAPAIALAPGRLVEESLPPHTLLESYVLNLQQPVSMAIASDGRIFFTERTGDVRLIDAGGSLQPSAVKSFDVDTCSERGLLGIALHPDFESNGRVYVYYSANAGPPCADSTNRAAYFEVSGGIGGPHTDIFISPAVGAGNHNGGNIHFGPDGLLYISVGDDSSTANSQDLTVHNGKMHRVGPEGEIPLGNPFDDGPGPNVDSIWALGLRNSFDFAFDPFNGNLLASENGPNSNDEVNLIAASGNYGWPDCSGTTDCGNPAYSPALWAWTPTIAPTGIELYSGQQIASWRGELFMCDFNTNTLRHLYLSESRDSIVGEAAVSGASCTLDVQTGPDGGLYFLDGGGYSNGDLMRIVALPHRFGALLRGQSEVPPVDTSAKGLAGFRLHADQKALGWGIVLRKIEEVTAMHIHCAAVGENGPIGATLFDGGPLTIPRIKIFKGVTRAPDVGNACGWTDLADVVAAVRSGDTYVNVHTVANPGGEIRGQIKEVGILPSELDL